MMTWIKNHPGQAVVLALSISLTISSVQLYRESEASRPVFIQPQPVGADPTAGKTDQSSLDYALTASREPGLWETNAKTKGRLFASKDYVLVDGKLRTPQGGMFHPPVPNDWHIQHGLNPVDPNVLSSDPDQDGFDTLLEWKGMDAVSHLGTDGQPIKVRGEALPADWTNPVTADSHPPYHTRLQLVKVEQIPFHLKFLSYDENPRKASDVSVQINAVPGRTEFVQVGEGLRHAPFDVQSFNKKSAPGPDGTTRDVSTVVVIDRRTRQEVTLTKGEMANSPESYAILSYLWTDPREKSPKAAQEIRVKQNTAFQLPPDHKNYKVAVIEKDHVDIILPSGETYPISVSGR